MNLHLVAGPVVAAVNPTIPAVVQVSTGSATGADGARAPTYADPFEVSAQVQSLTFKDLTQIDGLNLQGTRRAIYLFGKFDGVVRSELKGGDLVTIADPLPNAGTWLVAMVLEQWPDWCKVAATLQNDS